MEIALKSKMATNRALRMSLVDTLAVFLAKKSEFGRGAGRNYIFLDFWRFRALQALKTTYFAKFFDFL